MPDVRSDYLDLMSLSKEQLIQISPEHVKEMPRRCLYKKGLIRDLLRERYGDEVLQDWIRHLV